MKVIHNGNVSYYSGKADNYVYAPGLGRNYSIARAYRYPRITAQNTSMGAKLRNLSVVWGASHADYREEFAAYTNQFRQEHYQDPNNYQPPTNGFSHFVRMMFAWYESDPSHVDLTTVTVADIVALDADTRTIKRAVDANFLLTVDGFDAWNADIQNGAT